MKFTALSLLATTALLTSSSAAPQLLVETVVTEYLYPEGGDYPYASKVLGRSRILPHSGELTMVRVGQFEYAFTTTLKDNGTVDLTQTVTRVAGRGSPHKLGTVKRDVALGSPYDLSVGAVEFSTKVTLPK